MQFRPEYPVNITVNSAFHIGDAKANAFDAEMQRLGFKRLGGGFHSVSYSGDIKDVGRWLESGEAQAFWDVLDIPRHLYATAKYAAFLEGQENAIPS